jgi:hypothetical protein
MDDSLTEHLREAERVLIRMSSQIRAQDILIDLLLKAASASIEENREAILTALWVAQAERAETHGDDDDTARILARFGARIDTALARAPKSVGRRQRA